MRSKLSRWLLTATLMGGMAGSAVAQPKVRDHRGGGRPAPAGVSANGGVTVTIAGPRSAPPAPRREKIGRRQGWVWVAGSWEWSNGKWEWQAGRWEKERQGKKWRERRWEQKGDAWVKVEGDWIDYDVRPTAAPPAPQQESWKPRKGWVWVAGYWDWRNGQWEWQAGKWEKRRKGKKWKDSRWEQQNGQWVYVQGTWNDAPMTPVAAPPALQVETVTARSGFVWVKGRWDWQDGDWEWIPGHWERQRAAQTWQEGRWEQRNGTWTWVEGSWVTAAAPTPVAPPVVVATYPSSAPPAYKVEQVTPRSGFVWVRGRWDWRGGKWEWIPGHWEREKANQRWNDGSWQQQNGNWIWVEGSWGASAQPAPVAPPPPQPTPPPPPVVVAPPPAALPPGAVTVAPPAPQQEAVPAARSGFIWVRGRWGWDADRKYTWIPGHWERQRAGKSWNDGRWETRSQGNVTFYLWVEGGWR